MMLNHHEEVDNMEEENTEEPVDAPVEAPAEAPAAEEVKKCGCGADLCPACGGCKACGSCTCG